MVFQLHGRTEPDEQLVANLLSSVSLASCLVAGVAVPSRYTSTGGLAGGVAFEALL